MKTKLRFIFALAISALLSACGGGGGGGGGDPTAGQYDGNTAPVAITDQATADTVASAGTAALFSMSMGDPSLSPAASPRPLAKAKALVDKYLPKPGSGPALASQTQNCSGGGTVTVTDNNTSFSIAYANCSSGGYLTNGSIGIVLRAHSDNGSVETATFAVTVNSLRVEEIGTTNYAYMDGGYTYQFTYDYAGTNVVTFRQTSTAMYYDESYNDVRDELLLQNVDTTWAFDQTTGDESFNVNFTVTSTDLGGSVTVDTTQTFQWSSTLGYPTAGQVVFSSGDASVRVTVQAAGAVLVEYDLDGDGAWENSSTTTWAAL